MKILLVVYLSDGTTIYRKTFSGVHPPIPRVGDLLAFGGLPNDSYSVEQVTHYFESLHEVAITVRNHKIVVQQESDE